MKSQSRETDIVLQVDQQDNSWLTCPISERLGYFLYQFPGLDTSRDLKPILSKPLPLSRAGQKNDPRTHSHWPAADTRLGLASAPPWWKHTTWKHCNPKVCSALRGLLRVSGNVGLPFFKMSYSKIPRNVQFPSDRSIFNLISRLRYFKRLEANCLQTATAPQCGMENSSRTHSRGPAADTRLHPAVWETHNMKTV